VKYANLVAEHLEVVARLRVDVEVRSRTPVRVARRRAVRHHERRCPYDLRLGEDGHDVLVERHLADRVLERGVAIERHGDASLEVRSALVRRVDSISQRRLQDPLALDATQLQARLERVHALADLDVPLDPLLLLGLENAHR
jgi:hypothetical protein